MIVTQPKSLCAGVQPSTTTKIIPTKIVYGQQGKTQVRGHILSANPPTVRFAHHVSVRRVLCRQVLIKPKPMAFQTAVVSEQTRQLVSETLQQVSRCAESSAVAGPSQEGAMKEDAEGSAAFDITHGQNIMIIMKMKFSTSCIKILKRLVSCGLSRS